MKTRLTLAVLVLVALVASPARADIIFGTGVSNATTNIGSYQLQTPTSATGQPLGSTDDVLLAMSDVAMTIPAAGAARIEALATLFTQVMYTPIGFNWLIFELNPQIPPSGTTGTFQLKVLDNTATEWLSPVFALGNGQNRVFAEAINGQTITKVTVVASGALIKDIRQVRILAVPEPSTIAMLGAGVLGIAGLGFARRRRRQK